MNLKRTSGRCVLATLLTVGTLIIPTADSAAGQEATADNEGIEVLTRGPVHEAFAETISFDPEPGITVPNQPPEAIEEVPPDQRPEGDNVAWIPGYIAWDDEREDFLWVSGVWRDVPPGRQWIPGYWTEVESGYQWISGYWADAETTEIQYLPEPPATAEVGPNIAAPSGDHVWLPGCWIWQENRYLWQPGYWAVMQPDWDWVPPHYVTCPRGYVFVNGYYDYAIARRGVLFAPVYFNSGFYGRPGYSYSPTTVINLQIFNVHLFSRPRYHHYYFGDYYANNYSRQGFYPSFAYATSGFGYDPFFARQRWHHRNDRDWHRGIERDFADRRDNEDRRPPRTLADLRERSRNAAGADDQTVNVALSLNQLTQNQDNSLRFQTVNNDERQAIVERRQEMQEFRKERQKLEADRDAPRQKDSKAAQEPVNAKLPKSPVVAAAGGTTGRGISPPQRPETPKVDPNIEAKPRAPRDSQADSEDTKGSKKRPAAGTKSQDGNKDAKTGGKSAPKSDPKSKAGKSPPRPDSPKVDSKPGAPRVDPKPGAPKVDPKPGAPKVDPKPGAPKVDPKPGAPKVDPKPGAPRVDPKPSAPKVDPKPGDPATPKPDRPRVDPKPKGGKGDPNPNNPGVAPKLDRPRVDPQPGNVSPPKTSPPKVSPPKTSPPKVSPPKTSPPKVSPPKGGSKPKGGNVGPKPTAPKVAPRAESPKVNPPQRPKNNPSKSPNP